LLKGKKKVAPVSPTQTLRAEKAEIMSESKLLAMERGGKGR